MFTNITSNFIFSDTLTIFQLAGAILLFGCILFIYSFSAPNPKAFSAPDRLERLQAIASNVKGWRRHAISSVPTFFVWTIGLGVLAGGVAEPAVRWLALLAAGLSFMAGIFWTIIAVERLRIGREIETLILNHPAQPANSTRWAFHPYTSMTLLSLTTASLALVLSGFWVGWVVGGLALIAVSIIYPLWRDWPPFISGFLVLLLALGLMFFK